MPNSNWNLNSSSPESTIHDPLKPWKHLLSPSAKFPILTSNFMSSPPYRVSADTSEFKYTNWYGSRSAVRIARILKDSFELAAAAPAERVRWFVMGTTTRCSYNRTRFSSDGRARKLLSAHPIAPLISLHHLDYVQSIFPGLNRAEAIRRLMLAYDSDPGRTLQQSICYHPTRNWSASVSWGYNVQLYPFIVTAKDLSTPLQTFLTWGSWSQEPFAFNTQSMNFNPCDRPIIHYFDRVYRSGSDTTSFYRKPNPYKVKQCKEAGRCTFLAPRRQCCELSTAHMNWTASYRSESGAAINGNP